VSAPTTYKRTVTDTVCDNTRACALAEQGQEFKVKHSRNSHAQLAPARQALALVHTLGDEFAAEVAQLCATTVTPAQWQRFLDAQVPRVDATGQALTGRALTLAGTKRDTLAGLYRTDPRVAPWAGTAHGVRRPSAPTTSTRPPSAVAGPNATASRPSPATSDAWTGRAGTPCNHCSPQPPEQHAQVGSHAEHAVAPYALLWLRGWRRARGTFCRSRPVQLAWARGSAPRHRRGRAVQGCASVRSQASWVRTIRALMWAR